MLFIATGGTIDKQPVYLPDGSFDNDSKIFSRTHLHEMLRKARYTGPTIVRQLFMVDSLDMTNEHRKTIAEAIATQNEKSAVVLHGTDTMPETARYLQKYGTLGGKTIVLTGAMIPYSMGETSDAQFNLGSAIAYAQAMPSGVYVAMNGAAFAAEHVYKDVGAGVFRSAQ